jgi:CRP-like cAMP-binding protein
MINSLKQTDIFYGLNATQLELIGNLCEERSFDANEIIFPEGAASDELYVIVQGEVEIQVNPALVSARTDRQLPSSTIAVLRRGQSFGEIALVDQGVRSATARAATKNTKVLVLESKKILGLCESYPELGYRLMANLAADIALKMRNTDLLIREELLYGSSR